MAARRPSGKAMLAGAAALAAIAGGGAAAWVAAGDDDNPPANGPMAVATAPGSAQSDTESELGVPPQTQPGSDPPEPTPSTGEGGGDEQPSGSAGAEATLGKTETTRVPRKRRQSRAKAKRFAIPPAREFSGTGNARLGTVEIGAPSVVKWSTKGRFELRFGREAFPIIAPSASGQLVVPPYSFDQVRVIADGRWKISITPQK